MSHTQLHREYITSSEMYSLHLTHPKWTHTRSSGQPCYSARGAVGGSVPCSRTPQSWYWRRILPPPTIPAGPEIRIHNLPLTSPTRYPLGHDCPLKSCFLELIWSCTLCSETLQVLVDLPKILGRGALIWYSVSVSLRYWHFLPDRGIGQTRPIQIRYSAYAILCCCKPPRKPQKHHKAPWSCRALYSKCSEAFLSLMWGTDEY